MQKYLNKAALCLAMAALLMTVACSQSQLTIAAKSIMTAQDIYDTTMQASADAHARGIIGDNAKAQIIVIGNVVHDSIALAQAALITCLDASTSENESKLAAAIQAMGANLKELIVRAVAFGVTVSDTIKHYTGGGNE